MDSAEPRWRRKMVPTTIAASERNSLCQFWNDSNQKRDKRGRGLAVRCPIVVELLEAAHGVHGEREQEQRDERESE